MQYNNITHIARVVSVTTGVLACIFSSALYATTVTPVAVPIVSTASSEPAVRLSAAAPLACLVFEAGMPQQLALHGDQIVAWRHLERQHAVLFGNRCSDEALSQHSVLPVQIAENALALQTYEKNLHDFVSGLSEIQRAHLGEIARLYHESRAALEEKIMRHRLML